MIYHINEAYASIQGEGTLAGIPMIILRTQGCSVSCPFCDTRQTWALSDDAFTGDWADALAHPAKWTDREGHAIARSLRDQFPGEINWVLLTGGEPAEQPLAPLSRALHDRGYSIALETSGTALGHVGAEIDWVCVSPKVNMPGGLAVLPARIYCNGRPSRTLR